MNDILYMDLTGAKVIHASTKHLTSPVNTNTPIGINVYTFTFADYTAWA